MLTKITSNGEDLYSRLLGVVHYDFLYAFKNETFEEIKKFYDKIPNLTEKELTDVLAKARKNEDIQLAFATHPEITDKMLEKMLSKGRVYNRVLQFLFFKENLSPEVAKLIADRVTENTKKELFDFAHNGGFNNGLIQSPYRHLYIPNYSGKNININIINALCENIVDNLLWEYNDTGTVSPISLYQAECLEQANSTEALNKIEELSKLSYELPSYCVVSIINNKFVSDKTREMLFNDANFDINKVTYMHTDLAKKIYEDYVDTAINEEHNVTYSTQLDVCHILEAIFNSTENIDALKMDYIERCVNIDNPVTTLENCVASKLIEQTTDNDLLNKILDKLSSSTQYDYWLYIFLRNENLSPEFTQKIIDEKIKQLDNFKQNKGVDTAMLSNSENFCKALATAKLSDAQKEILFNYISDELFSDNFKSLMFTVNTCVLYELLYKEDTPQHLFDKFKTITAPTSTNHGLMSVANICEAGELLHKIDDKKYIRELIGHTRDKYTQSFPEATFEVMEQTYNLLKNRTNEKPENKFINVLCGIIENKLKKMKDPNHELYVSAEAIQDEILEITSKINDDFQLYTNIEKLSELFDKQDEIAEASLKNKSVEEHIDNIR